MPTRRRFLRTSVAAGASAIAGPAARWTCGLAPGLITQDRSRPAMPSGVQTGDVTSSRAMVWSRSDRAARLVVEWTTNERWSDTRTVRGPIATAGTGFTAAVDLSGLPAGDTILYRAYFETVDQARVKSAPIDGRFGTAPRAPRRFRLAFSGDMVGQGWGIDRARGGLRMYDALLRAAPDVFVHSGDMIYADGPLVPEVRLDDGTVWRNLVTPEKAKVAETLEEFRGNFAYHLLDEQARRFHASVPMVAQWDDHEVVNNWFPGLVLDHDDRYTEKRADVLAARARRAMFEFVPIRRSPAEADRVYRQFSYGPLVDLFVVDLRTYRGPNTDNRAATRSAESALLGEPQLAWLGRALEGSRAQWKVVASDMPLGLVVGDRVRDGRQTYEAWANADHDAPLGRELELAALLARLKRRRVRNVVWITADVHYAAAHHYSPERAAFTDFDPFWEFVAGPMHAGTFGPSSLDRTFGPDVRFVSLPPGTPGNRPPSDNFQFFGTLDVDPATRALTARLWNVLGAELWSVELPPEPPGSR